MVFQYQIMAVTLWFMVFKYHIMVVTLWFLGFEFQVMAVTLWFMGFKYQIMAVTLWFLGFEFQIMAVTLWFLGFEFQIMAVTLWFFGVEFKIMPVTLWFMGCKCKCKWLGDVNLGISNDPSIKKIAWAPSLARKPRQPTQVRIFKEQARNNIPWFHRGVPIALGVIGKCGKISRDPTFSYEMIWNSRPVNFIQHATPHSTLCSI